ncbi:MAG: MATE family efflux transporter, partial [Oscillospiraceae bacterium]|nr:MATE family efflux transporter [Oscillospiraceae bacterium]
MEMAGQDGVSAYGVIMYVNFIFVAIFIGFSIGSAPIVSFHYGAKNERELQGLLKKSLLIIAATGAALTAISQALAYPLSTLFVGYDEGLFKLTLHGFRLYSLSYFICGYNIYASSFFTSLNNGVVSAVISFSRTFVFQVSMLFILPLFLKNDGIWLAIVAAELLGLAVTVFFIISQRDRYGYFPRKRTAEQ